MEQLYKEFKGIANFRLIYIREAHALDGDRPNHVARSLDISEHANFGERCETAQRLIDDNELTIPTLIDDIKNSTDSAYSAKPDRVFLVRTDGRLGIAGDRGPTGFSPALADVRAWLIGLSVTGEEPDLTEQEGKAAKARRAAIARRIKVAWASSRSLHSPLQATLDGSIAWSFGCGE